MGILPVAPLPHQKRLDLFFEAIHGTDRDGPFLPPLTHNGQVVLPGDIPDVQGRQLPQAETGVEENVEDQVVPGVSPLPHCLSELLFLGDGEVLYLGLLDSGFHKEILLRKRRPRGGAAFPCFLADLVQNQPFRWVEFLP